MEGKIYKIVNDTTDEVYIGSTHLVNLEERLNCHVEAYKAWINRNYRRNYISSFEILKYKNYQINLLETVIFSDINELRKREGYHQLNNKCVNLNIAGNRPRNISIINDDPVFYCSCCGISIKNTYSFRLSHLRNASHRRNRTNIHRLIHGEPEIKKKPLYIKKTETETEVPEKIYPSEFSIEITLDLN